MYLLKYLIAYNICARRKLVELIKSGAISVNNQIITNPNYPIKNGDIILYNGNILEPKDSQKLYYLLNKPKGTVSTTMDDKKRLTVIDLIPEAKEKRLFPVGRLDYDTEGALLITNDGELTNILTHPSYKVEKEYRVKISSKINPKALNIFLKGVKIEGLIYKILRYRVTRYNKENDTTTIEVVLNEGKNHEVKILFNHLGFEVIALKRLRFDVLTLDGLKPKEYRSLKIHEIKQLYRHKNLL